MSRLPICPRSAFMATRIFVTRAEIQKALWGEETFVEFDQGINYCIKEIRDALGDSADTPRYVQTVPRVGYRFVPPPRRASRETELAYEPARGWGPVEGQCWKVAVDPFPAGRTCRLG